MGWEKGRRSHYFTDVSVAFGWFFLPALAVVSSTVKLIRYQAWLRSFFIMGNLWMCTICCVTVHLSAFFDLWVLLPEGRKCRKSSNYIEGQENCLREYCFCRITADVMECVSAENIALVVPEIPPNIPILRLMQLEEDVIELC